MRDRYYRIEHDRAAPENGALVCIWRDGAQLQATWSVRGVAETCSPEIALFCAVLARIQSELVGVFVWLAEDGLWEEGWGDLVKEGEAPDEMDVAA